MHLPKFFMVNMSPGYKFYKNTIMFPSKNSYNPVNVVTPLTNATIRMVSKCYAAQNEFDGVLSRDTLGRMYPFKCKFSGYEITINLNGHNVIVPGVYLSECDKFILPKGSPIIIPPRKLVVWQIEARSYLEADILCQDDPDNSLPDAPPPPPPPPPPGGVGIVWLRRATVAK